jgi:hypothetical protein
VEGGEQVAKAKEKAEPREQFTEQVGFKVTPTMRASLERIGNDLFPGLPNPLSVVARQFIAKGIAEYDARAAKDKSATK